ncbi:hypothetical protein PGTUg99_018700 [Puccinia graminis f. sp. tritici]|uniref:Uncharacterized protein n=1 Tax=Puccinia graminis f. sp. tritici TaxID=56615 RepID=A0A5B0PCL3_PUCGR|nr:hypothetical protein PGTUg99_018700 [Puccinia graminis f. sp. tritici]
MLRGTIDGTTPRHIPVFMRRTYQHLQFTSVAPIPTNAHEMRFLNYLVFSVGVIPLVHALDTTNMGKPNFLCPDPEHPTRVNGFCIREPTPQEYLAENLKPGEYFRFSVNILGKPASSGDCCAANIPNGEVSTVIPIVIFISEGVKILTSSPPQTWLVPVASVADYCTLKKNIP